MITVNLSNDTINIKKIAESGQCFRFNHIGNGVYSTIYKDNYLEIKNNNNNDNSIELSCDLDTYNNVWKNYFDISDDYSYDIIMGKVIRYLNHTYLTKAYEFSRGMRILNQDNFEVLISFILSQRNSIPKIKNSVEKLCKTFGDKLVDKFTGKTFYAFPKIEKLYSEESFNTLDTLSLGYRSEYVKNACIYYMDNYNGDSNRVLSVNKVLEIKGVGIKVASCYSLFSAHNLNEFPIDVWIGRVLDEQFNGSTELFTSNRVVNEVKGVLQQYIFYYERNRKI